jgi:phosphogluconate dehydratase
VVKVSAVKPEHRVVRAQAVVVNDQQDLLAPVQRRRAGAGLYRRGALPGPTRQRHARTAQAHAAAGRACKIAGFKVALVTDGRMSGASGKVPAAIHLSPEALANGPIARVKDGDWITLDCARGVLELDVDAATFAARARTTPT